MLRSILARLLRKTAAEESPKATADAVRRNNVVTGALRSHGHEFHWYLSDSDELLPSSELVLQVVSKTFPLRVAIAIDLHSNDPGSLARLGPAAIHPPGLPRVDGELDIGKCFLFPVYKRLEGKIDERDVRSVVESLLNGNRLKRCREDGMPWCEPFIRG